jgi:SAM-dependent methyltransferase
MIGALQRYYWKYVDYLWCRLRFGLADPKHAHEFRYWRKRWREEGGSLRNEHYQALLLAMAGEAAPSFLRDKVVADFGCGPRGSLCWAAPARERIGIDVLADAYKHLGAARHNMRYVRSTETEIPLPTSSVDVLFTLNAMDHVHNLAVMCGELLRILKPGGTFIGSFNLDEEPGVSEPQSLTPELLDEHLLRHLEVQSRRIAPKGRTNAYEYFFTPPPPDARSPRVLWVRGKKKETTVAGDSQNAGCPQPSMSSR